MSEPSSLPDRRVTDQDRERIDRYFSQVLDFPQEFKTWLLDFVPLYSTIFQEAVRSAAAAGAAEHYVGEPFMWVVVADPDMSLLCDGTDYAEVDYPELFDVIGNSFDTYRGLSDPGAGRFRVPDYRGLFPVMRDTGDSDFNTFTDEGGAKDVTLTAAQSGVPAHTHTAFGGAAFLITGAGTHTDAAGATGNASTNTAQNTAEAAANAHENLPPYFVAEYWMYAGR